MPSKYNYICINCGVPKYGSFTKTSAGKYCSVDCQKEFDFNYRYD